MKFRTVSTVAATTLVMVLSSGALAQAAPAGAGLAKTGRTGCAGVLIGPSNGNLTKQVTSVVDHRNGSFTIYFSVTSPRPDGVYRLRDCTFVDANRNGSYDRYERTFSTDERALRLVDGRGTGSVTVRGSRRDTACGRLTLSGDDTRTERSNTVCKPLREFVIPPGTVGLLGLTGLLGVGLLGAVFIRRRRGAAAYTVAG